MKTKSLLMLAVLAILATVGFTSCDELAVEDNPMQSYITMRTSDVTLKVGETYVRKAVAAGTAVVVYSSSDATVATVDQQGKVTAITPGTATITAQTTGYNAEGKKIYLAEEKSYKVTVVTALSTPLTLQVLTPGTIVVNKPQPGMQYSLNGGKKTAVPDGTAINGGDLSVGDKVSFYGDGTSITAYYVGTTNTTIKGGTAEVKVYGNIMSLVDEENFATNKTLTANYTFVCLFMNYTTLTDASDLLLPATTLTANCYNSMFYGCTSLTTAPKLPATTLAQFCYNGMFKNCTSLTTAPAEIPAMTMADQCCGGMFRNCTSLTTAPKLPATTLAYGCYYNMFYGCTSLTTAPKLPATTLGVGCYNNMFNGCTSLTAAYVKAAFAASSQFVNMFVGCTNAATLHTTAANKGSWDNKMGSGKQWSTWTTASDWTD